MWRSSASHKFHKFRKWLDFFVENRRKGMSKISISVRVEIHKYAQMFQKKYVRFQKNLFGAYLETFIYYYHQAS